MLEERTIKVLKDGKERKVTFTIHTYFMEDKSYRTVVLANFINSREKFLFIDNIESKSKNELEWNIIYLLNGFKSPLKNDLVDILEKNPKSVKDRLIVDISAINFLEFLDYLFE